MSVDGSMGYNILASVVVAALVSGVINFFIGKVRLYSEDIVKERRDWREHIRKLSREFICSTNNIPYCGDKNPKILRIIYHDMQVRLNPTDNHDKEILRTMKKIMDDYPCNSEESENRRKRDIEEFSVRVSHLLKHDWERAKHESRTLSLFTPVRKKYCRSRDLILNTDPNMTETEQNRAPPAV